MVHCVHIDNWRQITVLRILIQSSRWSFYEYVLYKFTLYCIVLYSKSDATTCRNRNWSVTEYPTVGAVTSWTWFVLARRSVRRSSRNRWSLEGNSAGSWARRLSRSLMFVSCRSHKCMAPPSDGFRLPSRTYLHSRSQKLKYSSKQQSKWVGTRRNWVVDPHVIVRNSLRERGFLPNNFCIFTPQ